MPPIAYDDFAIGNINVRGRMKKKRKENQEIFQVAEKQDSKYFI